MRRRYGGRASGGERRVGLSSGLRGRDRGRRARWIERRSAKGSETVSAGHISEIAIFVPGRALGEKPAIRPTHFGQIPSSRAHI